MSDGRLLHAFGAGWDAAEATAIAMRIEAVLETVSNPPSDADVQVQGRALMRLSPPSGTPISHRVAPDGTRVAVAAVTANGGNGSLAFGMTGHPRISDMVLDLPLGPECFDDERLIWTTAALVERLTTTLDAVRRTRDLLVAGRRADAVSYRRKAGTVAKCVEAVVAGLWHDAGSLSGPLATVIATTECATPWTKASMGTAQPIGRPARPSLGSLPDSTPKPSNAILDEEGLSILGAALPLAVDVSWNVDVRTTDGDVTRRMVVRPMEIVTMISRGSLLDPMQTLRAHRVASIPDHCISRIGR